LSALCPFPAESGPIPLRRTSLTTEALRSAGRRQEAIGHDGIVTVGRLLMTVKSAHVYETELPYMHDVLADQDIAPPAETARARSAQ
jgi:hypothetical protein